MLNGGLPVFLFKPRSDNSLLTNTRNRSVLSLWPSYAFLSSKLAFLQCLRDLVNTMQTANSSLRALLSVSADSHHPPLRRNIQRWDFIALLRREYSEMKFHRSAEEKYPGVRGSVAPNSLIYYFWSLALTLSHCVPFLNSTLISSVWNFLACLLTTPCIISCCIVWLNNHLQGLLHAVLFWIKVCMAFGKPLKKPSWALMPSSVLGWVGVCPANDWAGIWLIEFWMGILWWQCRHVRR